MKTKTTAPATHTTTLTPFEQWWNQQKFHMRPETGDYDCADWAREGFDAGYKHARNAHDDLLAVARDFVREWEATWTDPEDQRHEWIEIYQAARAAIARAEART